METDDIREKQMGSQEQKAMENSTLTDERYYRLSLRLYDVVSLDGYKTNKGEANA